jgi:hypothetical protein
MSTSQQKTTLNPSATEFVPSFALQQNLVPTNNGTNNGGGYVNNNSHYNNQRNHQHYNNSNNNSYQNHHHHNNNNNRSNHYNNNNNQYRNNNGSFYNNNGTYINPNDVDPIEIEARCEAVIEILQDDNIRDQLNPSSRFETTNHQSNSTNNNNNNNYGYNYDDNQEPPCDDEEEMLEMMAMQEECRLEMMKFYIQSQNPSLFEEIYHDVSYPDAVKKPTEELRDPIVKPSASINTTTTTETKTSSSTEPTQGDVTPTTTTISTHTDDSNLTTESTELKDLIINHLNPDAYEFIPSKFSNLNLNDDSVETAANEAN